MKRAITTGVFAGIASAALLIAWTSQAPRATRVGAGADGAPAAKSADTPQIAAPTDDPRTVLILYRSNCPDFNKDGMGDSEEVARYYAERRGVPKENLLGIKVTGPDQDVFSKKTTWSYDDFQAQLIQPLRRKLTELGPSRILYIVTTFGMPVRVQAPGNNRAVAADAAITNPFLVRDDGLHLWRFYEAPNNDGRYKAPRFAARRAGWEGTDAPDRVTYLVSRLDGMGALNAKALVDGALYAEKFEVDGYAYVDSRYGVYKEDELDEWLKQPYYHSYELTDKGVAITRRAFAEAGLKVRQQTDYAVIGTANLDYTDGTSAATAPRAVAYAGWYNYGEYNNVFDWLPGSVAMDFDSFSLGSPRTFMASFGGMALLYGACGTVGCFDEPGTTGHPRPDVLFNYYMRGYNFAEASWLSMPYQPFYNFAIGDPLMRPYGRKREADTRLETPTVKWFRKGDEVRADVQMPGDVEIARVRMVVTKQRNDALLETPGRSDGAFRREVSLTAQAPKDGPAFAGLRLVDPAGNTLSIWKDLRE